MTTVRGKVSLVTGISGALGSTVAKALVAEGSTVAGTYGRNHPEDRDTGAALLVQCDVTNESSVISCFKDVRTKLGEPSIVIHTAGGFDSDGDIESTSIKTWNNMIDLTLRGSFLVLRESLRSMADADFGRVVLVSAMSASTGGKGAVAYKVAKSGVETMVKIAHTERRHRGLTINAVAPGVIDTPKNRKDMPKQDFSTWVPPERIAAAILYLCSDMGGSTSGAVIPFPW